MPEISLNLVENMDEFHFEEAFNELTPEGREKLNQLFTKWLSCANWDGYPYYCNCNHERLVENIKKEHFLKLPKFISILKHFVSHADLNPPEMIDNIKLIIEKSFFLGGKEVTEQPTHFATAILRKTLEQNLRTQLFSADEIMNLYAKPFKEYNSREKRALLKLGERLIWLTWDEYKKNDPYSFLIDVNVYNIWNSMALGDYSKAKEMVVFHFSFEPGTAPNPALFRPTWCDANFFDKFKPTDFREETRWGLTFPTVTVPIKSDYSPRRPEGVILAGHLPFKHVKKIKLLNV